MSAPLSFAVASLEGGPARVEKKLAAALLQDCLDGEGALVGEVAVSLDLALDGSTVRVEGAARGEWELECCRCLAKTRSSYAAPVSAELSAAADRVDAFEEVRQALILAVPAMRYCRADCKGLCAQCGADLNKSSCGCVPPPIQRFKVTRKEEHHA